MQKYLFFLLCITLIACDSNESTKDASTKMNTLSSRDIEDRLERIKTLNAEIKAFSELEDAEYELFNVNGFSDSEIFVPGASSWDYRFVVKIKSSNIPKWKKGFIEVDSIKQDRAWMIQLIAHRENNWKTTSTPQYFVRENTNVVMCIFEEEGIVFKRVLQN